MIRRRLFAAYLASCVMALAFVIGNTGCQMKTITSPLPVMTPTPTATPYGCPVAATLNLVGNLDSTQRADMPGGVIDVYALPLFSLGMGPYFYNNAKIQPVMYGSTGMAISQVSDFTSPEDTTNPVPHLPAQILNGGFPVTAAVGMTMFNWDQPTPLPPATVCTKAVTDIDGNVRQITFQFFQVVDLGQAGVNPNPPHQAAWAWYAFETTGGATPSHTNLLGGTALVEGYDGYPCSCDRNNAGWMYLGELLTFNTDGSLASQGGAAGPLGPTGYQVMASLYLPPVSGTNVSRIYLNFGTAGVAGYGRRNGLTGDAAPSSVH
jgi:hypothetical protein